MYMDDFALCILRRSLPWLQIVSCEDSMHSKKHSCKLRRVSKPSYLRQWHGTPSGPEKFIVVIFDYKLSFLPHIKSLRLSCPKAFEVLGVVGRAIQEGKGGLHNLTSSVSWSGPLVAQHLFSFIICGSARDSHFKLLDSIHHQGLYMPGCLPHPSCTKFVHKCRQISPLSSYRHAFLCLQLKSLL